MPNDSGALIRIRPRGVVDCANASSSAASPSLNIRLALAREARPLSVSDRRREVRFSKEKPSAVSSRLIAFEMVGFDNPSASAVRAKEPSSATLAKIAQASKSGKRRINSGTGEMPVFLFLSSTPVCIFLRSEQLAPGREPMIERRAFAQLGGANHGWLDAKHHFSFASYYDPARM